MGFSIITVYVDDLNLIGTHEELIRTTKYLKKEFKMKDLGKTKFCLDLLLRPNDIYKFMTLLPKDYYLIPDNGAKSLFRPNYMM